MNIRGLHFKADSAYSKYIYTLLNGINIRDYQWYISQTEILYYDKTTNRAESYNFSGDFLSGEEFLEMISRNDHLVYLTNIQAYPKNRPAKLILSYQDFLESDCSLIILCADSEFYDIYCKNETDIQLICANALNNNFKDVEYITDENDQRTGLSL